MKGLLVRVGIDQTAGRWNGPVDLASGRFTYVPIPQNRDKNPLRKNLSRFYEELTPSLDTFELAVPTHLQGQPMHLDPDFENLTYGDVDQKGKQIQQKLKAGDFLVFYSAFNTIDLDNPSQAKKSKNLCYALMGILFINRIEKAKDIPKAEWHKNAHTRIEPSDTDIVVFADSERSGRFERAIPIGEFRNKSYRVTNPLLKAWGGLSVKDGFIQRSARLPEFLDPQRFLLWLEKQNITLLHQNN